MFEEKQIFKREENYGGLVIVLAISVVLVLSFWPYIYFNFGFHNDFAIWEYDNSRCCSFFVESDHLVRIGRFLQSYLQNIYLMYFESVSSFRDGRLLALVTNLISVYLLYRVSARNGLSKVASLTFALGVFLLPPSQVNNSWVANYVPGVLNALLVIFTILLVPTYQDVRLGKKICIGRVIFAMLFLLCVMYIYPPTAGFFLLPILMRLFFTRKCGPQELKEFLYLIAVYLSACALYFVSHKLYTFYNSILFPAGSLYDFNVSASLLSNFSKFILEIVPAFLNLFLGTASWWVAGCVLMFILWSNWRGPIQLSVFNKEIIDKRAAVGLSFGIFVVVFGLMNVAGLLAAGSPPTFFRTWHPGMAAVLLILMAGIAQIQPMILQRILFFAIVLAGVICSLNASLYLAGTLDKQYHNAKEQFAVQFDPGRSTYLIIEQRPSPKLLGMQRWGELGFIHILAKGHGNYILQTEHQHRVHPSIESIAARENNIKLVLEMELTGLSPTKIRVPVDLPYNRGVVPVLDNNVRTNVNMSIPNTSIELEIAERKRLACYKMVFPWPRSKVNAVWGWKLYGAAPGGGWELIDEQNFAGKQGDGSIRYFQVRGGRKEFKFYKFEFALAKDIQEFQMAEIELFGAGSKCGGDQTSITGHERSRLNKIIETVSGASSAEVVGFVNQGSISTSYARLQRAFDNIYYTFWETALTDRIDVFLRPTKLRPLYCYEFSAGEDRAHHRMPKSWNIWGRNASDQWYLLDARTDNGSWKDNEVRRYKTAKQEIFEEYRIAFDEIHGGEYLRVYEIKFSFEESCSAFVP